MFRFKVCMLTAAAMGLVGLSAAPANAFGGRLFHRGSSCCDPCASACSAGCGAAAAAPAPAAQAPAPAPAAPAAAAPCSTTVRKTVMVPE